MNNIITNSIKILNKKHVVSTTKEFITNIPDVKIIQIPTLIDNYTYIIVCNSEAVLIDPPDSPLIENEIKERNLKLKYILITHHHFDHIGGLLKCKNNFNPQIIGPNDNRIPNVDKIVNNSDIISFGDLSFKVMSVPGHTKSHLTYYCEKLKALFCGDTVFPCGYGFIRDNAEKIMWESLKKIRLLPDDTLIFCAHEYTIFNTTFACEIDVGNDDLKKRLLFVKKNMAEKKPSVPTTIKMEKDFNPFLRWDDIVLKEKLGISEYGDFETFKKIRSLKNEFNKRKH